MIELRPYQAACVEHVLAGWANGDRRQLSVMPTGTGKTICFAEILRRRREQDSRPALVIAHREELVEQARDKIENGASLRVEVEMADHRAMRSSLYELGAVVATVQTLSQEKRLNHFPPDCFGTVVVDEAHHAVASTYRRILDRFVGEDRALLLGVTATPDRKDEVALGKVFGGEPFVYEIRQAISDGWLVPIVQRLVVLQELDALREIETVAGDYHRGKLEALMEGEALLDRVAWPALREAGDRPTIVFTASVAQAYALAERLREHRSGCAQAVDGTTRREDRRKLLGDFAAGAFQFLVNCAIVTEGWDQPRVGCIVMARPTRSRALYAQMAGRGMRLHPGKQDLLLLDMVGVSEDHKLITAVDVLDGDAGDPVIAAAKQALREAGGGDVGAALDRAREELSRPKYGTLAVDPFGLEREAEGDLFADERFAILGIQEPRKDRWGGVALTGKQAAFLSGKGIGVDGLTKWQASKLIDAILLRIDGDLCTFKMARQLWRNGLPTNLPFGHARDVMSILRANRWRSNGMVEAAAKDAAAATRILEATLLSRGSLV